MHRHPTARTLLAQLALTMAFVLTPSTATAELIDYVMEGDFLEFFLHGPFIPDPNALPFSAGDSITVTFTLDDQAPPGPNFNPNFQSYPGAVIDISLLVDNGLFEEYDDESVIGGINGTSTHQWSVSGDFMSPGRQTNIPVVTLFNEETFEDEDFYFRDSIIAWIDDTQSAFTQVPPELLAPTESLFDRQLVSFIFESAADPSRLIDFTFEIDTVNVPEPSLPTATVIGLVSMASTARRRFRAEA